MIGFVLPTKALSGFLAIREDFPAVRKIATFQPHPREVPILSKSGFQNFGIVLKSVHGRLTHSSQDSYSVADPGTSISIVGYNTNS